MNFLTPQANSELPEVPALSAFPSTRSWSWDGIISFITEVPGPVWTMVSMALCITLYSVKLGWAIASGLMILLFIHECGHLVAASILRLPVSAPIFIPYIGAVIDIKEEVHNRWKLALMGIAGPVTGPIATMGCFAAYQTTGSPMLATLAAGGCVQNLFNLIPMGSLDGGHIVGAFARWMWIPGYLLMCWLARYIHTPVIWISLLVMLPEVLGVFRSRERRGINYRKPSAWNLVALATAYAGLLLILSFVLTHSMPGAVLRLPHENRAVATSH